MPTYTFEDESGERFDVFMQMSEAPGYGAWVELGGKKLRRIVETPVDPYVPDYTCTIRSQARWDPTYPRYDNMGHGVILSKKEHREYKAKNEHLEWD
jgi:hypothetical protein